MYRFDTEPWWRKHDGARRFTAPIVPSPYRHCFPTSRQDLIDIVRDAEATSIPVPLRTVPGMGSRPAAVRAVGSGWALSEAAVTEDFIVETHSWLAPEAMNNTLYEVVGADGCLSNDTVEALVAGCSPENLDVVDETSSYLFHVEAGTRVYELYCRLDAGDTDPRSLAVRYPVFAGAWALPTAGGAGGQSIVGAFSTGTHGADVRLTPISDGVLAMHLIGTGGKEYWIERSPGLGATLTDDDRLVNAYPGINIIRDEDVFQAVMVSAGRMGILYSVVLRVVRQYGLLQHTEASTWSDVRDWIGHPDDPHFAKRGLTVVVNPNQSFRSTSHTCFVSTLEAVPLSSVPTLPDAAGVQQPRGRVARCGANAGNSAPLGTEDFVSSISHAADAQAVVGPIIDLLRNAAELATFGAVVGDLIFPGLGPILAAAAAALWALVHWLEDVTTGFVGTFGDLIAAIANRLVHDGHYDLIELLNDLLLSMRLAPGDISDINYAIRDGWDYTDQNLETKADSLEIGVDAGAVPPRVGAVVEFVDSVLARVQQLKAGSLAPPVVDAFGNPVPGPPIGEPLAFGGYLSLRFTGRSAAMIAMQQFALTCHGELAGLGGLDGNLPLLTTVETDAAAASATVHWGQLNTLTAQQVRAMYPRLEKWRIVLAGFTDNGREVTFSTPFSRSRGLEVIRPRITAFSASPLYCAAGDSVALAWDAQHNPPWTTVSLEVRSPVGTVVPRDGLPPTGSATAVMGDGINTVALVAQTSLSGLGATERQAISITGFGPINRYYTPTVPPPTCQRVDGEDRWVAEFTLPDGEWSDRLLSGNIRLAAGSAGPLTVRKDGSEFLLSFRTFSVGFVTDVAMAGTWQLLSTVAGCGGAPPTFGIDITVRTR